MLTHEVRIRSHNVRTGVVPALALCMTGMLLAASVGAQQSNTLPEGATVSALGRTAQVRSDGSFIISNVPSNIGQFRVRLIHPEGTTAQSGCLTPVNRGITIVPPLIFGPLPALATSLIVQSSMSTFTATGQTAQLQVISNLQGGGTADVTGEPCTTYISSNNFLAGVNASGLVTVNNMPLAPATLVVTVMTDGVVGTASFLLNPGPAVTDLDSDGIPNDWELRNGFNPLFAGDAGQDADLDGLTNLQEFQQTLEPRDADTDRDGISDGSRDPDGAGFVIAGPDPEPLRPEAIAPAVTLTSPPDGVTLIEGEMITLRATATDNVGVGRVTFTSSVGGLNIPDLIPPFEANFVVPLSVSQMTLSALARDIAGNTGTASATVNIIPDPLTTVAGRVVDEDLMPLSDAVVSVLGRTASTGSDGTFSIPNVPTIQGNLVVEATFTAPNNVVLTGRSAATPPVREGTTDVGDIRALLAADFVYVNNNVSGANTVSAFSVAPNGALSPITGSPFASGGLGTGSAGFFAGNRLTICVVGSLLFVANERSNNISVFSINPVTGALTVVPGSPFATGGSSGISLGVTPDNRLLFSANDNTRNITVFSIAASGALSPIAGSPFPAGGQPDGIKVSADGRFLAVALISPDAVAMFNIGASGALAPVPGSPFPATASGGVAGVDINCASNLVFGGEASFDGTNVDVFSVGSNGSLTPVPGSPFNNPGVGSNSNVVVLSPDDRFLFVSNQASNTVTVFNVAASGGVSLVSGSPFANSGGSTPQMMTTNKAGTLLYVNNDNGAVSVFAIADNGALSPVPGSPFAAGSSIRPGIAAFPAKNCIPR